MNLKNVLTIILIFGIFLITSCTLDNNQELPFEGFWIQTLTNDIKIIEFGIQGKFCIRFGLTTETILGTYSYKVDVSNSGFFELHFETGKTLTGFFQFHTYRVLQLSFDTEESFQASYCLYRLIYQP